MLRQQVVIEKDRVVEILAEQFARARDIVGDVQIIAVEAFGEPDVTARVVVEQKNANRTARHRIILETEPAQQPSDNTHLFVNQLFRNLEL